jgi:hypothetical protein
MLGDIDLIFSIWVYSDELQIKFTFRSGPIIFGRVVALGLWNLAKYLVVTTFFRYAWRYWLDFLYLSVYWWVTYQVYISLRSKDFWPSYGPWTLKFDQIFSCHHCFSLCLEILTWFLIYECIMISYWSSLHFVPVQWYLAELWLLDFEIWSNI